VGDYTNKLFHVLDLVIGSDLLTDNVTKKLSIFLKPAAFV